VQEQYNLTLTKKPLKINLQQKMYAWFINLQSRNDHEQKTLLFLLVLNFSKSEKKDFVIFKKKIDFRWWCFQTQDTEPKTWSTCSFFTLLPVVLKNYCQIFWGF